MAPGACRERIHGTAAQRTAQRAEKGFTAQRVAAQTLGRGLTSPSGNSGQRNPYRFDKPGRWQLVYWVAAVYNGYKFADGGHVSAAHSTTTA